MLANGVVSDMNHGLEAVINVLLLLAGYIALTRLLRQMLRELGAEANAFAIMALAGFFYFSVDQSENLLWGWHTSLFACMAGLVWAIYLLSLPGLALSRLALAALCTIIAVYGYATAWTLAPIGAGLILLSPGTSRTMKVGGLVLWTGLFALLLVHYISVRTDYDLEMLGTGGKPASLWTLSEYVANFFGAAVFRISRPLAPLVAGLGFFSFILVSVLCVRHFRERIVALRGVAALMAFSLGAAVLTALGRAAVFGTDQAFSNRYTTFSNYAWLGLLCLAVLLVGQLRGRMKMLAIGAVAALLMAKTVNLGAAVNNARLAMRVNTAACEIVRDGSAHAGEMRSLYSAEGQPVEERVAILKAQQASLFRPAFVRACAAN